MIGRETVGRRGAAAETERATAALAAALDSLAPGVIGAAVAPPPDASGGRWADLGGSETAVLPSIEQSHEERLAVLEGERRGIGARPAERATAPGQDSQPYTHAPFVSAVVPAPPPNDPRRSGHDVARAKKAIAIGIPLLRQVGEVPRQVARSAGLRSPAEGASLSCGAPLHEGRPDMIRFLWAPPPDPAAGASADVLGCEGAILPDVPLASKLGEQLGERATGRGLAGLDRRHGGASLAQARACRADALHNKSVYGWEAIVSWLAIESVRRVRSPRLGKDASRR
jgi:hypothetical protein